MVFTPLFGLAANEDAEFRAVLVTNPAQMDDTAPAVISDTIEIVYDPETLKDSQPSNLTFKDLQSLNQTMQSADYQQRLEREIIIPESTEDQSALQVSQDLSPEELQTFLGKKKTWLTRLAKTYQWFHFKPAKINNRLALLNRVFFSNAPAVAGSNTTSTAITLGAAGGIGLNDWLLKPIRKIPGLEKLPERAGFYFCLSTGFSFVRYSQNGVVKYRIEPIIEFRYAKKILLPFAFVAGGLMISPTMENRKEASSAPLRFDFAKASVLTYLHNERSFGGSLSIAPTLGYGLAASFTGEVVRIPLTPAGFIELSKIIKNYLGSAKPVLFCRRLFKI